MKKSGGIVIGMKKKKKPIVIAPSKNSRPSSPVTVVNESSTNNTNANSNAPKSKHKLVIKPFQNPPSIPPDFYETSLSTLQRAAVAVLRREPLLSTTTVEGGRRRLSREELYTSVQDLIVHGYGKELYGEVVNIVDKAAGEVVMRLTGEGLVKSDDMVGYCPEIIVAILGTDEKHQGLHEKRLELLKQWHAVCRVSYAEEYLTFVRSIFLVLDRAFVFMSECDLEMLNSGSNAVVGENLKGKVMDRTSLFGGVNSRVWELWEVGIACLRRHLTFEPEALTTSGRAFSVLSAMVLVTTHALLAEYDDDQSINRSHQAVASIAGDTRPLIRNCVQSCIDLGSTSALLEELIVAASSRFRNESKKWGSALNESRKTAPQFLSHVEHRLKQSSSMTTYYLPSNAAASTTLRQLANRSNPLVGSSRSVDEHGVVWKSINSSTRRILPAIIEAELLSPHLVPTGVLHPKHLYPILDDCEGDNNNNNTSWKTAEKTFENAKRLYGLCWRMTATFSTSSTSSTPLENLRIEFGKYGRLRGSEIITQGAQDNASGNSSKETEKSIIPDLLLFKAHLQMLLTVAFRNDEAFAASVRSILEDVCNGSTLPGGGDGGRRIAELLAKHVDARFKDAKAQASPVVVSTLSASVEATSVSTDHNESFQNQIMTIFRHVHSKDVFEAFYKRDLAKRLLTGRSVSSDVERSFLSKLKAECGAGYTSKMEGMFKDMDLSRDIMTSYATYSTGATGQNVATDKATDMDVQVLTTNYWPAYPKHPNIILPPELIAHQANFESYYKNKYQGRRIAWQYSLGNCIVKAFFPKQSAGKELIVNLCQTLVLLCFQYDDGPDGRGLTVDDIIKKTGIDDRAEVERVLQSLSLGRDGTRVLIKVDHNSPTEEKDMSSSTLVSENSSPGKSKRKVRRNVGPHDRFLFNASFTSNQRRIRITNITMKETAQERSETHEAVSKDRLYLIDAAVVRIMKARKTIDHRDLMGEVMTQLKFPSSSADIKKRVESLIEREYMERVEGNRSRYNYLA